MSAATLLEDAPGTELGADDFRRLAALVDERLGIKMPEVKRTMLRARLLRRVRQLGLPGLQEYFALLFSERGRDEEVHFLDLVTTNKTSFFREVEHFRHLAGTALPTLVAETPGKRLELWSAACSTGEEPYSLAMTLLEVAAREAPGLEFHILGTDVCTKVLETARRAVYRDEQVAPVPATWRKKYLLRSKDPSSPLVRIAPEVRNPVDFRHLNFMDERYGVPQGLDVVFCRNALIYFDRPRQQRILERLCAHLRPGGFLYTGHSESLHGLTLPLETVAKSVFRKVGGEDR